MVPLDVSERAMLVGLRSRALEKPWADGVVEVKDHIRALAVGITYEEIHRFQRWNLSISSIRRQGLTSGRREVADLVAAALGAPPTPVLVSPKGVIHWAWVRGRGEGPELPEKRAEDGDWEVQIETGSRRTLIGRSPDRITATEAFMVHANGCRVPASYYAIERSTGTEHFMGEVGKKAKGTP